MEDDSAPIEHSWLVSMARKSGQYNFIVPARLSAHTDWSAVFNGRRIVFHTPPPPITLYCIYKIITLWFACNLTGSGELGDTEGEPDRLEVRYVS